jgi:hypothetical protein
MFNIKVVLVLASITMAGCCGTVGEEAPATGAAGSCPKSIGPVVAGPCPGANECFYDAEGHTTEATAVDASGYSESSVYRCYDGKVAQLGAVPAWQ